MKNFFTKYSNQINGYIFILPAFLIIGIFGIFPVFFGMYMSVHKWKVFKGRFLGFENYQKILGDISSFWLFILGLLILIFSYWFWSEYKSKFKTMPLFAKASRGRIGIQGDHGEVWYKNIRIRKL